MGSKAGKIDPHKHETPEDRRQRHQQMVQSSHWDLARNWDDPRQLIGLVPERYLLLPPSEQLTAAERRRLGVA